MKLHANRNPLFLVAMALAGVLMALKGQEATAAISTETPPGLGDLALKREPALFFTLSPAGTKVIPHVGFFIDTKGLALCALEPLYAKAAPVFRTGEGKQVELKKPVVLAVFPEERLALVKFDHKPAGSLTLSNELATVGTWVAVVPSAFSRGGGPVAGPIVAHRLASNFSYVRPPQPPEKQFSIAMGRNPSFERVLLPGAPIINARGEVVATFAGSQELPGQTLRLAHPLVGFKQRIDEAVKQEKLRTVPLSNADLPLDPAILSDEYMLMGASAVARDLTKAREFSRKVVEKFPDSLAARSEEFAYAMQQVLAGQGKQDELVSLAKRCAPPENSTALEQAAHQERLGQALVQTDRLDEAMVALQKSDTLDPRAMASMTLATLHEKRGELDKAEDCWRRTVANDEERIEYWDRYQKILTARGKWKEADMARDRIFLLEDLYRSR